MLPVCVVADVTVKPPAVSETLIDPADDTVSDAEVAAVFTAIPETAVIETTPPDTSATLSTVADTDVPDDSVTLAPLVDAILDEEPKLIAPVVAVTPSVPDVVDTAALVPSDTEPLAANVSVPDVVDTAALVPSDTAPLAVNDRLPVVVDKALLFPTVIEPPDVNEMLPEVAATVPPLLKTMLPLPPVVETVRFFAPKLGLEPSNVTTPGESFSVTVKLAP
jgi:hypothetical protein